MTDTLRGSAAIVGTGLAGIGEAPGRTHLEIQAEAIAKALDDAGLTLAQVDGLFTSNLVNFMPALTVTEYLGIKPKYVDGTNIGGSSFLDHAIAAASALNNGLCDVALICYGSNQRTASGRLVSGSDQPPYDAPYKPRMPVAELGRASCRERVCQSV